MNRSSEHELLLSRLFFGVKEGCLGASSLPVASMLPASLLVTGSQETLGWHLHPSPARSDSLTQEAGTLKSRFPSFSFNFHYVNFAFPGIEILNGWAHLEIKVSKDLIYINGDASLTCREAETRMDELS